MSSNHNFYTCLFCEKFFLYDKFLVSLIFEFNRGKDIFAKNPDIKELTFLNACYECYINDHTLDSHGQDFLNLGFIRKHKSIRY